MSHFTNDVELIRDALGRTVIQLISSAFSLVGTFFLMLTLSVELTGIDFNCQYDEKDSIGKRYRRQDAIGTPYCITIDHDTLEDNCVTLRDRDTMQQERIPIDRLRDIVEQRVSMKPLFKQIHKI